MNKLTSFKKNQIGDSELHIAQNASLNFQAVICLHRNDRGPALGGCRFLEYASMEAATADAIRLSRGMRDKAAMSDLPHSGGKAVIMHPKGSNREVLLQAFADFVNTLEGQYITTIDSGTTPDDMVFMHQFTPYVTGQPHAQYPAVSDATAMGVFNGIKAAVKIAHQREDLVGLRVAIQGTGNVGEALAKRLSEAGAILVVSDVNELRARRCAKMYGAQYVSPDKILSVPCDVFSPCAWGPVITSENISQLSASIIAGAANAQLADVALDKILNAAGILYVPDFVINAGGLIHLSFLSQGKSVSDLDAALNEIGARIFRLNEQGNAQNKTLLEMAQQYVNQALKKY